MFVAGPSTTSLCVRAMYSVQSTESTDTVPCCTPCWYVCSYEHPYLLADNRHYPFYIWKNIFRYHHTVKYLLVSGYSVALLLMLHALCE